MGGVATTGVFLYACLFLKTNKKGDLLLLGFFSLVAAYTHYYSLIAAFWADAFVLVYLLLSRINRGDGPRQWASPYPYYSCLGFS